MQLPFSVNELIQKCVGSFCINFINIQTIMMEQGNVQAKSFYVDDAFECNHNVSIYNFFHKNERARVRKYRIFIK